MTWQLTVKARRARAAPAAFAKSKPPPRRVTAGAEIVVVAAAAPAPVTNAITNVPRAGTANIHASAENRSSLGFIPQKISD